MKLTHTNSRVIKNFVYGGVDGIITTFSIIAASFASNMHIHTILIIGLSHVIADAFSMGMGDFISSMSEMEYILSLRNEEQDKIHENKLSKINSLTNTYIKKGLSHKDAKTIVSLLSQKIPLFIDHLLMYSSDISNSHQYQTMIKNSIVMIISFGLFGCIPLLSYILGPYAFSVQNKVILFQYSCMLCIITLFVIGAFSGYLSKKHLLKEGTITVINGSLTALLSYICGWFVHKILEYK